MKAERLRKHILTMVMAADVPVPPYVAKEMESDITELEAKAAELDRREKGVKAVGDWDVTCQYCNETSEYKHRYCPNCGTKLIWSEV